MENKEECCCEGTITREGAIHTKNSCCVYIENKEERHEHSMLCNGRNFGEGNKYFYGGNFTGMKEPENCDCKSEAPQTPELKGNKFTWSPEKAKELQEICDRLNKTPDSMEWEKELNGILWANLDLTEPPTETLRPMRKELQNDLKDFIRKYLALAHSSGFKEGTELGFYKGKNHVTKSKEDYYKAGHSSGRREGIQLAIEKLRITVKGDDDAEDALEDIIHLSKLLDKDLT